MEKDIFIFIQTRDEAIVAERLRLDPNLRVWIVHDFGYNIICLAEKQEDSEIKRLRELETKLEAEGYTLQYYHVTWQTEYDLPKA